MSDTTMTAEQAAEVLARVPEGYTTQPMVYSPKSGSVDVVGDYTYSPCVASYVNDADGPLFALAPDLAKAATHYRERAEKAELQLERHWVCPCCRQGCTDPDCCTAAATNGAAIVKARDEALAAEQQARAAAEAEVAVLRGELTRLEFAIWTTCPECDQNAALSRAAHQATTPEPVEG